MIKKKQPTKAQRKAKRKKERERVDELMAAEESRVRAERTEKRIVNAKLVEAMKLRRQYEKEQREIDRIKKKAKAEIEAKYELILKDIEPKLFRPLIGKPNASGETPVQIDAKTIILVKPGKDIHQVINRYQKALNLTITIW